VTSLLVQRGRVLSPADGLDGKFDILVRDGVVERIERSIAAPADVVIDGHGLVVAPGFVDIHVHLREPGGEASETLETGLSAAVAGGFTSVALMPNTRPVNDNPKSTRMLIEKAARLGLARVFPIAAVSLGSEGEQLSDFDALVLAGAVGFSDDGRPIRTAGLARQAMEAAARLGVPVIEHCEDATLSAGGSVNEGKIAAQLGIRGIPNASEDVCLARDVVLAAAAGTHLHVAHLSTRGAVEMVREARKRGIHVTCEVTPHHFTLTDEAVLHYGTHAKMNPPLRSATDVAAVLSGIADSTVDVIATDHAPHSAELKQKPLTEAAFGVTGLETALALALKELVERGRISLGQLILLMSTNPGRIVHPAGRSPLGRIQAGGVADLSIFDPALEWIYRAAEGRSKSRNTPFDGWAFRGAVTHTIVGGSIVYQRN
jgi:dihydroorotase